MSLWAAIWPRCIGDRMGSSLCCLAKRWPSASCGTSTGRLTSRLTASHSPSLTGHRSQCDRFRGAIVPLKLRPRLREVSSATVVKRGQCSRVRHEHNDDGDRDLAQSDDYGATPDRWHQVDRDVVRSVRHPSEEDLAIVPGSRATRKLTYYRSPPRKGERSNPCGKPVPLPS